MLEQDRSGESSHEDAIASCSREKGSNHTDDDRAVSYKDRLENGHGQKIRSVSSRERNQSKTCRPDRMIASNLLPGKPLSERSK
ncbi:hypothetical protein N7522_013961 [Penicillium canescens]|nr:hypothetical protein N7522_013961 [Penicillium canescens]